MFWHYGIIIVLPLGHKKKKIISYKIKRVYLFQEQYSSVGVVWYTNVVFGSGNLIWSSEDVDLLCAKTFLIS